MASLNEHDLETLFSGAPQYFARSEGHFTGAPHPSVAFPWDETLQIRDLTDHVQIEDEAWSNVTAWPHITRRFRYGPGGDGVVDEAAGHPAKKRSHYYPRCRERPSMLSMQGLEKGTVGYEAALELGVSDALEEEQYGFDEVGHRPAVVLAARKNLMDPSAAAAASKAAPPATAEGGEDAAGDGAGGVKYVGETQILEELIRNGQRYAAGTFSDALQTDYFYNELFHKILRPTAKLRRRPRALLGHGNSANLEELLLPQIEALLDVLAMPNVWIDFSHVEWRLRLGQILWASSAPDTVDPGGGGGGGATAAANATRTSATTNEFYTERYWLLLQLLLATELLLRLDAITDGDEYGPEFMRPSDVHRLEKTANASVRWSLILARAWLENIEVVRIDDTDDKAFTPSGATEQTSSTASSATPLPVPVPGSASDQTPTNLSHASSGTAATAAAATAAPTSTPKRKHEHNLKHTIGWITTLTRKLTMLDSQAAHALSEKKQIYAMKAHNGQRQQRGLAHFAQQLRWPDDQVVAQLAQSNAAVSGELQELLNGKITASSAAAASPKAKTTTASTANDKAAGTAGANPEWKTTVLAAPTRHLQFNHRPARRRKVVADLHPSGWLSKTYQSGLILPGDSLCNLLMATLLEADTAALHALGPTAHLGAGFVYRSKSFWSTACIVGRVLAAGAGAAECMGWISSDVVPQRAAAGDGDGSDGGRSIAVPDGWLSDVHAADVPEDRRQTGRRARLWAKMAIERESSVLGDSDFHGPVRAADFVLPHETAHAEPPPRHASVALQRLAVDTESAAELAFALSSSGASDDQPPPPQTIITCRLTFDVYFATAHPCVPSPRVKVLKSPSSPTIQHFDMAHGPGVDTTAGHALHKYYTYAPIHLTALLRQRDKSLDELVKAYTAAKTPAASASSATSSTASVADTPPAAPASQGVLVIDCITGFASQPNAHEMPLSPTLDRCPTGDASSPATAASFPPLTREISPIASLSAPLQPLAAAAAAPTPATPPPAAAPSSTPPTATKRMHHETRRRRFGSDMEMLVRAFCADKGWNALISRRRRGCLACAIREAGALGWRVVIRVD